MAVIRNLVVKISADISSLSKGLQNASKSLTKASQSLTRIGTSLTTSITLPLVALGAGIVKTSASFEQSMANAASVAGATGEEFKKMTDLARQMGAKTIFSASEAADALYYMASAGYKVDQMADSIEATLNLASATQYDLAATTDVVIAALNQFNLEASSAQRVTNVFASAIGNSMASMEKLANSMGYVGPVANSLGYEIEEVVGALSILYNAGYDGSTAGTTLRQALVSLMNPTSAALSVFEELGLTFDEVNPATNDFASIVDRLGLASMDTAQAMEVFGARGGPGMLALMNQGGSAIREMTESITGTNKATEMAAIQINTLSGEWKLLTSELEEISIAFGDILIPILREFITKYISPLTKKLMGLSNQQKKQVVQIALIAAAIGPLFLALGKLTSGLSLLIKIAPLLFSKIGLIIAVIGLVAASFIHLYKTNESFRKKVLLTWERIQAGITQASTKIKEWWKANGQAIQDSIVKVFEFVSTFLIKAFQGIYQRAMLVWPIIKEIIIDAITAFRDFWKQHGEKIKTSIISAFTKINAIITNTLNSVLEVVKKVFPVIKTIISDTFSGIKNLIRKDGKSIVKVVNSIATFVSSIVSKLKEVLFNSISKLIDKIGPIWENLKSMFSLLWETIKDLYKTLKPIFTAIGAVILVLFGVISGVINGTINSMAPFVQTVISAVKVILEVIRAVCALLRGDFSAAWEHIKNIGINVWETLKQFGLSFYEFFKGFIEGFVAFFSSFKDKVTTMLSSFWDAIQAWFGKVKEELTKLGDWVWGWIGPIIDKIVSFFSNLVNSVTDGFNNAVNKMASFFTNLYSGVKNIAGKIGSVFENLFSNIKAFFEDMIDKAFNWGKNLIRNIGDGIESSWNTVVDGVKSVGQLIADFLGFGSPTKKGPGQEADKWIPNLMDMMREGIYSEMPKIQTAALQIASTLNLSTSPTRAMVGTGSSPFGELLNGLLETSTTSISHEKGSGDIIMQIDGQTFARIITPKLTKEYKRNGIILREA